MRRPIGSRPTKVRRATPPHAAWLAIIATACGTGAGESGRTAVVFTDSAGVRIASYATGPFTDTVPMQPTLTIGREGEPDYEFFNLQQISPLASGNVVVANGGTHELLFYGPDGVFLRRVGRQGEGPAEFGFLSTVYPWAGDTLVVMDPRRRRLVFFDSAGVFARGESFAEDLTREGPTGACVFPGLFGVLGDGTRLTRGWGCMDFRGEDGVRATMTTLVLAGGERRDTLERLDVSPVWERGSPRQGESPFEMIPFGAVLSWAVGPGHVYLSHGIASEVRVYDAQGRLVELLREDAPERPVTAADREAYREERLAMERPHDDAVPFPESFGAYRRLLLSHEGELWAQWAERPSAPGIHFTVFSADRRAVRRVVLPEMDVRAIRGGLVYGSTENDLGIETVVALAVPELP